MSKVLTSLSTKPDVAVEAWAMFKGATLDGGAPIVDEGVVTLQNPPGAFRPRRLCGGLFLLGLLLCAPSCQSVELSKITLQVGPEKTTHFVPKSAFAHYFELPGQEDELHIILASYEMSCLEYRPPEQGEIFITVTLRAPVNLTVEPGLFAWQGLSDESEVDETEEAFLERAALPFVRLAQEGRPLPPGGSLALRTLEPENLGLVEGRLNFRDAEEGQPAKTALLGDFSVKICHLELDAARSSADVAR